MATNPPVANRTLYVYVLAIKTIVGPGNPSFESTSGTALFNGHRGDLITHYEEKELSLESSTHARFTGLMLGSVNIGR